MKVYLLLRIGSIYSSTLLFGEHNSFFITWKMDNTGICINSSLINSAIADFTFHSEIYSNNEESCTDLGEVSTKTHLNVATSNKYNNQNSIS